MSISLEVSIGEALDKLSILEIKLDKIQDLRKINVEKEYNYLKNQLIKYINGYNYFYRILKKVNLEIWELQDILRSDNSNKDNFYIICDEILNLNDSRYLAKKKLNELSASNFKEQKGYKLRNLNIILNTSEEILKNLDGAIRYYSFYYDELYIYCNEEQVKYISEHYKDDLFIIVNDLKNVNEKYDYININNNTININLTHSYFVNKTKINNNPLYSEELNKLYEKINLDVKIYDEYKK